MVRTQTQKRTTTRLIGVESLTLKTLLNSLATVGAYLPVTELLERTIWKDSSYGWALGFSQAPQQAKTELSNQFQSCIGVNYPSGCFPWWNFLCIPEHSSVWGCFWRCHFHEVSRQSFSEGTQCSCRCVSVAIGDWAIVQTILSSSPFRISVASCLRSG